MPLPGNASGPDMHSGVEIPLLLFKSLKCSIQMMAIFPKCFYFLLTGGSVNGVMKPDDKTSPRARKSKAS